MKQAREIIAISNFVRSSLPDRQKKKAVVIRNPFNAKNQLCAKRELKMQLNIPKNSSIILFVGTIQQQKNPLFALHIISKLLAQKHNIMFLMAGRCSHEMRIELERYIRNLEISDSVRILGFRDDISNLMAISDILLAPAENEGFGRSIIEAMISKVPVVAAESGGHVEIIENNINGLLCRPNSSLSFTDAILKL